MPNPIPYTSANVRKLAIAFATQLRAELSAEDMKEVIRRNAASRDPMVCASHDFTDANMVMDAAFRKAFGRDPFDHTEDDGLDMPASHTALMNDAWTFAKSHNFALSR